MTAREREEPQMDTTSVIAPFISKKKKKKKEYKINFAALEIMFIVLINLCSR